MHAHKNEEGNTFEYADRNINIPKIHIIFVFVTRLYCNVITVEIEI